MKEPKQEDPPCSSRSLLQVQGNYQQEQHASPTLLPERERPLHRSSKLRRQQRAAPSAAGLTETTYSLRPVGLETVM